MSLSDEQRSYEQRLRVPAGVAAILSGVLSLVGVFLMTTIPAAPEVGVLEALTPALNGQLEAEVSPRIAVLQHEQDHFGTLLLGQILTSLGLLALAVALFYLYRATDARAERTPGLLRYAIYFGPVISAIATMALLFALNTQTADLLDSTNQSTQAVEDARTGGVVPIAGGFSLAGLLGTALATVLVSLHAMRAGLLTRFMGILGIIVGVFFVLGSQVGPLPLVQAVWTAAIGVVILGRWPGGNPPAWERGEAIPWPSQQELREQRLAAAAERRGGSSSALEPPVPPAPDDAAEPAPAPRPSARTQRKRKRR